MGEERYRDPVTGGEKGMKDAQLGAVDPQALMELARVAGHGAKKYARYNFLRGYPWSLSFDAMQRHALAFWTGEDTDPDSGLPHMAHVAWHALALVAFGIREVGTDDRPFEEEGREEPDAHLCYPQKDGCDCSQIAAHPIGSEGCVHGR